MPNPYIDHITDGNTTIDIYDSALRNTIGQNGGLATLDNNGRIPSSQLPSYVDDVLEYASTSAFPATGETGKIYVALDTNKTYRWGGSEYVEISESLALGETSSTAYRGDRGKTAYDHSQVTSGNPHNVTASEVGLGNVDNTSDSTKKTNFTGSIASGNTGFVTGGDTYTALGNKADKVSSATNGNLAGLNASGNPTDSGISGDMTTTSATGNPISIADLKSAQIALNPVITFEPIQAGSGTPSPSNIRAISGYDKVEVESCGKNLVDGKLSGYAINANGTFASETGYDVVYAPVVKGASYVISSDGNATMAWFTNKPTATSQAYDSSRYTYTVGVAIIAPITGWIAFRTVTNCANSQIEYGSTQSTYEPPIKIIDLSESLGRTVYGATLDVRTGVLTVTHNAVDMGNLAWTKIVDGSYTYFRSENITDMYPAVYTSSDLVCSCYQTAPVPAPQIPDASIRFYNNAQMLIVFDSRYTDATSLQTALVGQKVGYPLATPFTIQLTPREISLLKDYVYVSTNGTNIQFDYHNGELASLADVAQLAETYNRFADYIKGLINV